MQRVAIARAIANEPRLVLADEPTGNLDSRSGQIIYELLQELSRERTVVVVTHAENLARLVDRVIHIKNGRLLDGHCDPSCRSKFPVRTTTRLSRTRRLAECGPQSTNIWPSAAGKGSACS